MNIEKSDKNILAPKNIALLASGAGTNAKKIIEYFQDHERINCSVLISNKPKAPALEMAAGYGLDTLLLNRQELKNPGVFLKYLQEYQ